MVLAKLERTKPRQMAERVVAELRLPDGLVSKVEIAGPGFINFWLADDQLADIVGQILERGSSYPRTLEVSWGYSLEHFDRTKRLLTEVPLECRVLGIESEEFAASVERDLDRLPTIDERDHR